MTKRFDPKARAKEIAAELKAAEQQQREYDDAIDEAVKHAGRTRAEFVEMLYRHFGIDAEMTERRTKEGELMRTKDGSPILVKTDRDEGHRIARLAERFEELVLQAERGQADAERGGYPTSLSG
ncbi:hypothetical protein [Leucobacter massiliensis]|uniref:Uncharacterized protein n=1 Tax=Leucobacter massiliensis TaxID=1686285 RepID=A0A2S9QLP2_9MICO|nr:hypothetical protein [Leucobacter massiliensis]PRI10519.1 hypothetical protein B4915_10965 [Leucobacter massiliensis]